MNKSVFLKICSIALVMVMCLLTVTGCNGVAGTSSVGDTSSLNKRPGVSSEVTSSDTSSDVTSSDSNSSGSGTASSATDNTVSDTIVTTTQIVKYDANKNPLKKGINFGQLNFDYGIGYDSYMLQGKYYDMIREKGFDHIRVPVDFFQYMGEAPEYKIDEEFMHKMDTIINLCLSAGLKLVLDAHHFAGDLQVNVSGNEPRYYAMWEQLAERYQNYPSGLVFELINEPGNLSEIKGGGPDVVTTSKIMRIQANAIKIIRKTNPTRLIVHATQWNNGAAQLMDTEPLLPDDENIIMSVHCYSPGKFTHQGADWSEYEGGTPGGVYWDDSMKYEIQLTFNMVKAYQEKYGRPVWIGEIGAMHNSTPEGQRALYAKAIIEIMNDAKCGWCWFDFDSNFGIFSQSTDAWMTDGVVDALVR